MTGSVRKYEGRRGRSWRVTVDLGPDPATGKRRQRMVSGFATKKQAEAALVALLGAPSGPEPRASRSQLTLGEYLEQWLEQVEPRYATTTFRGYSDHIRGKIIPQLGAIKLGALSPEHLRAFYGGLRSPGGLPNGRAAASGTVKNVYSTLNRALVDAVKTGLIATNPNAIVDRGRVTRRQHRVWNVDEASRFLDAVTGERLYAAWVVALGTGLRKGEILGLRRMDVDLRRARLAVRQTITSAGYLVVVKEAKTKGSHRQVSLDPHTVTTLRSNLRRQDAERDLAGLPPAGDETLVFTMPDGRCVHPHYLYNHHVHLVSKAGVPMIRFHDLRHTSATIALKSGRSRDRRPSRPLGKPQLSEAVSGAYRRRRTCA